ncbi:AlpA family phage regulatory protein (plasmid) [Chromobacterium amazonense]|uniref:helix-turn-helix transcriptional regulator n=1 Tax=Chromobacterium amazonense TaxID=1382803 RepID=UPI00237EB3F9|nr:AlpA family phage regulatory protein [Chromobacterium amazonense]MDE1714506.1 AlpA family phage regulatory protein [Chromobacterium amazonense]
MAALKTTSQHIKQAPSKPAALPTYGALPATGYVRISDLRPILPFSDSTIWRRVRAGTFPAPVKLSERITAWRAEDVRHWLDAQAKEAA